MKRGADLYGGGSGALLGVVEDAAELSMLVCLGLSAYAAYGSEREGVSILRHSANTDELTNLSNRSFFNRAAARRLELSRENGLPRPRRRPSGTKLAIVPCVAYSGR